MCFLSSSFAFLYLSLYLPPSCFSQFHMVISVSLRLCLCLSVSLSCTCTNHTHTHTHTHDLFSIYRALPVHNCNYPLCFLKLWLSLSWDPFSSVRPTEVVFLSICSTLEIFPFLFGHYWNISAFRLSAISKSNCNCSSAIPLYAPEIQAITGITSGRVFPTLSLHAFLGLNMSLLAWTLKKTYFMIIRIITPLNKRSPNHSLLLPELFKMYYCASHSRKLLVLGASPKPQIVQPAKIKWQSWRL